MRTWSNGAIFWPPPNMRGDDWFIENGPALRMVPSKANQIESIVLKAESLEQARTAAAKWSLRGRVALDGIELDPIKTLALRVLLKEN